MSVSFFSRSGGFGIVTSLLLAVAPALAQPTDNVADFRVSAGSLEAVLLEIAKQSHSTISFNPAVVGKLRAQTIQGSMTVREALKNALSGTALEAFATENGAWAVRARLDPPVPAPETPATYPLPKVVVTGRYQAALDAGVIAESSGFVAPEPMPLSQIPQSISVITRDSIDRQQSRSLKDVLESAAGVSDVDDSSHSFTYGSILRMRGMNAYGRMVDGMLESVDGDLPVEGIERVEVVKGPVEAIQGSITGNGVVNVVSNVPQMRESSSVGLKIGEGAAPRGLLETSGVFDDAGKWGYRINAVRQSPRDFGGDDGRAEEFYLAPVLRYRDDTSDVVFGIQRRRQKPPILPFTTSVNGQPDGESMPIQAADIGEDRESVSTRAYVQAKQQVSQGWSWHGRASWTSARTRYHYFIPQYAIESKRIVIGNTLEHTTQGETLIASNELKHVFDTGSIKHHALIGADFVSARFNTCYCGPVSIGTLNFAAHQWMFGPPSDVEYQRVYQLRGTGLYAEDAISVGERWHVLGSIRRSHSSMYSRFVSSPLTGDTETRAGADATSWSLGASYQLTPDVALYASAKKGKNIIPGGLKTKGLELISESILHRELGLKANLLEDRLSAELTVFRADSDSTNVPDWTKPGFYLTLPGHSSRGVEAQLVGQLRPGWDVVANMTRLEAKFSDPSMVVPAQPQRFGRIWTSYAFQEEPLQGYGVTFAMTKVSRSYADLQGALTVPGYVRLDASVFYRTAAWTAELSVKNLMDQRMYSAAVSPLRIAVLPSRALQLTVRYAM